MLDKIAEVGDSTRDSTREDQYVDYNYNFAICFQWRTGRPRNILERRYLQNITHCTHLFITFTEGKVVTEQL